VKTLVALVIVLGGCFNPKAAPGGPCGPGGACPDGLACAFATQTCEDVAGGVLELDRTAIEFDMLACGGTASLFATLHNAGDQPIGFTITTDVPGLTVTPMTGTIAPDASVQLSVTAMADPVGLPGVVISGNLLVQSDNLALAPINVPVSLSTIGGVVTVDASTVDFGQVAMATSHNHDLTVGNSGNTLVSVMAGPFTSAPFTVTGMASFPLAPGASHVVTIQFVPPASQSYAYQLPLQVTGATCQPTPQVDVVGAGSVNALLLDHTSIDFGAVACGSGTDSRMLVVTNTNASAYPFTASVTTGATSFSVAPTSGTVVASGTTSISVSRVAVAIPAATGMTTGNLHLVVTGPPNGTSDTPLQYDVTGSSLSPSATSISFGDTNPGSSKTRSITVTNNGNQVADVTVARTAGSSTFTGPGSFQIAPGAAQMVTFTFQPTTTGTVTADFSLSASNQCSSTLSIHVTGKGDSG
jgi:hypothetical protein